MLVLFAALLITAGLVLGTLASSVAVWLALRKKPCKGWRYFVLLGTLEAMTAAFYIANFAVLYILRGVFDRWIELFLVFLLAILTWKNFSKARLLSPR